MIHLWSLRNVGDTALFVAEDATEIFELDPVLIYHQYCCTFRLYVFG